MQRIETLDQLRIVARNKGSVIGPSSYAWVWKRPCPAAFVINLPAIYLDRLLKNGMYLYEKEPKRCVEVLESNEIFRSVL